MTAVVLEAPTADSVEPVSVSVSTDGAALTVPAWVRDLASFRRWVQSEDVPEETRVSYHAGEVWIDMSKERIFSHNQVEHHIAVALENLIEAGRMGRYFPDGLQLSNVAADLSCGPDGCFVSRESLTAKRVWPVTYDHGPTELEGTPDMVLEVVSDSSVDKDYVVRRDLYWQAGIPEYWIVDARGDRCDFAILRRTAANYTRVRPKGGWLKSSVFDKSFRLVRSTDDFGHPTFRLEIR